MSTAPRRPDLANEPVGRLMLRLSIPTITAQLVNMLYNLVDRIYISYIPDVGTLALTGLGVCLPIILLVSAFAALCASSGAPLASIAMGQRNHEKAEGILGSCTALLLCVSAVLTVVLSCFYTPILLAFGATEDALPYAQRYIAIYSLGTVFVQLSLGLNPFITAQGFSKAGMLTVLIGAVLNTLLDPLFIFVFHMDVQGAALATVISQAVSAAFVLRFLTGRQTILHLKRRLLRLNWKLLAPCVALGLAPFIMQSTESLVSVCFNTSLRAAGGTLAVGTMTICSTLMQFALLPLQGLSQGAQPIISFNYGAKRPERVKAAFRILLISCLAFSAVLGLTCIFAPQIFVYLLTPDAALREYAIPCVRLYMAGVTIFGAQIACQQTFVALGNAKCSLFLACLRKLILLIPLVYLLPLFIPDTVFAIFLAEPIADVLAVLCTVTLFMHVFRKTMRGNCGLMAAWQAAGFLAAKKARLQNLRTRFSLLIVHCSLLKPSHLPERAAQGDNADGGQDVEYHQIRRENAHAEELSQHAAEGGGCDGADGREGHLHPHDRLADVLAEVQGGHVVEIRVQRTDAQARHQQRRHRQDVIAGNKQRRLRHAEDAHRDKDNLPRGQLFRRNAGEEAPQRHAEVEVHRRARRQIRGHVLRFHHVRCAPAAADDFNRAEGQEEQAGHQRARNPQRLRNRQDFHLLFRLNGLFAVRLFPQGQRQQEDAADKRLNQACRAVAAAPADRAVNDDGHDVRADHHTNAIKAVQEGHDGRVIVDGNIIIQRRINAARAQPKWNRHQAHEPEAARKGEAEQGGGGQKR